MTLNRARLKEGLDHHPVFQIHAYTLMSGIKLLFHKQMQSLKGQDSNHSQRFFLNDVITM